MNLTVVTANFLIFCDRNITKSKENYEIQKQRGIKHKNTVYAELKLCILINIRTCFLILPLPFLEFSLLNTDTESLTTLLNLPSSPLRFCASSGFSYALETQCACGPTCLCRDVFHRSHVHTFHRLPCARAA